MAETALESGESELLVGVKKYTDLHRSTVWRHNQGIQAPREEYLQNRPGRLTLQQEQELVAYINKLSTRGTPATPSMVRSWAVSLAESTLGKNWVNSFVRRHNNTIKCGYLKGFDLNRKKADNWGQYKLYFELVCARQLLKFS